ncbi:MAG: hypothetical protein N4A44_03135 [Alphaproteobacteria bacterium]|jgi:hypothetical protein|nr:hypothetical protein [Alphaproteobacteria bacterium]
MKSKITLLISLVLISLTSFAQQKETLEVKDIKNLIDLKDGELRKKEIVKGLRCISIKDYTLVFKDSFFDMSVFDTESGEFLFNTQKPVAEASGKKTGKLKYIGSLISNNGDVSILFVNKKNEMSLYSKNKLKAITPPENIKNPLPLTVFNNEIIWCDHISKQVFYNGEPMKYVSCKLERTLFSIIPENLDTNFRYMYQGDYNEKRELSKKIKLAHSLSIEHGEDIALN